MTEKNEFQEIEIFDSDIKRIGNSQGIYITTRQMKYSGLEIGDIVKVYIRKKQVR